MTTLEGARSEQVATVHPSPPAVVSAAETGRYARLAVAPASTAPAVESQEDVSPTLSFAEQVQKAAEQIEAYLHSIGRSLEFRVDETSGRTVITVLDSNTGEVVRQIPGDETLRLARSLGGQPHVLIDLAV